MVRSSSLAPHRSSSIRHPTKPRQFSANQDLYGSTGSWRHRPPTEGTNLNGSFRYGKTILRFGFSGRGQKFGSFNCSHERVCVIERHPQRCRNFPNTLLTSLRDSLHQVRIEETELRVAHQGVIRVQMHLRPHFLNVIRHGGPTAFPETGGCAREPAPNQRVQSRP